MIEINLISDGKVVEPKSDGEVLSHMAFCLQKVCTEIDKDEDTVEELIFRFSLVLGNTAALREVEKEKDAREGGGKINRWSIFFENLLDMANGKMTSINKNVIRGIDDMFNELSSRISRVKAGIPGGGMGDPQHQVFNISAGTTTVTTTHSIAAGGNAVMNFVYDNANLERTNHYTVGSDNKTITFNTDVQAQFENNTTASITYIRG